MKLSLHSHHFESIDSVKETFLRVLSRVSQKQLNNVLWQKGILVKED